MGMLANPKHERYAFERALLVPRLQAARAAGYDQMTAGNAAKLDRNPKIAERINELRAVDEDMLREKRQRIEARLNLIAYTDIFEFAEIDGVTNQPVIDWREVLESEASVIISKFKFDKDTGQLTDFERDNAENAISQLRDMYGFKAPARTELTGANGGPIDERLSFTTDAARARALAAFVAKTRHVKTEQAA